jgi:hypothetical protein
MTRGYCETCPCNFCTKVRKERDAKRSDRELGDQKPDGTEQPEGQAND